MKWFESFKQRVAAELSSMMLSARKLEWINYSPAKWIMAASDISDSCHRRFFASLPWCWRSGSYLQPADQTHSVESDAELLAVFMQEPSGIGTIRALGNGTKLCACRSAEIAVIHRRDGAELRMSGPAIWARQALNGKANPVRV